MDYVPPALVCAILVAMPLERMWDFSEDLAWLYAYLGAVLALAAAALTVTTFVCALYGSPNTRTPVQQDLDKKLGSEMRRNWIHTLGSELVAAICTVACFPIAAAHWAELALTIASSAFILVGMVGLRTLRLLLLQQHLQRIAIRDAQTVRHSVDIADEMDQELTRRLATAKSSETT